jgi:hypothetical protein
MARVFVIQEGPPTRDISGAAYYGSLETIIPARWSVMATSKVISTLREKLRGFCDEDFLLPMGDPSIMIMAGAIAAAYNHGKVRILKWDNKAHAYIPIEANLFGFDNSEEQ